MITISDANPATLARHLRRFCSSLSEIIETERGRVGMGADSAFLGARAKHERASSDNFCKFMKINEATD
jgi:hypothetical protein